MADQPLVTTIAAFRRLDDGEMLEGYMDGFEGKPVARDACSPSYFHGWRNGMIESDRMPPDEAYATLQHAFLARRLTH